MSPTSPTPLRAIVLGNDAVLAARPATPTQVARACLRLEFDFVAPVSWGEELLATHIVHRARSAGPPAVVAAHCPFVAEALRGEWPRPACWTAVAPPVATARYLRAAFADREVHVTFAGRCPGATAPDVDERVLPEVLLGRLVDAGVVPDEQPDWFDTAIPPERARHLSLPGGIPAAPFLAAAGAELCEAAPATLAAVARAAPDGDRRVIDLGVATGCTCARVRREAQAAEPPRVAQPVVVPDIEVDLSLGPPPGIGRHGEPEQAPPAPIQPVARERLWADVPSPSSAPATLAAPAAPGARAARTAAPPDDAAFVGTFEPWSVAPVKRRPPDREPGAGEARGPGAVRADPRVAGASSGRYAFSLNTPEAFVSPRAGAYDSRAPTAPSDLPGLFAQLRAEERRAGRLRLARGVGVLLAATALTIAGALGAQWLLAGGLYSGSREAPPAARLLVRPPDAPPSSAVATDSLDRGVWQPDVHAPPSGRPDRIAPD